MKHCNNRKPEFYLFNTDAYIGLQENSLAANRLSFHNKLGIFQATETSPGVFISPERAPFGGFDVRREEDFLPFVEQAEAALRLRNAHEWHITLPPLAYDGERAVRAFADLCRSGYVVTRQEYNQSLPVDQRPFLELGNYANRKRFNRALRLGVSTRLLTQAEYFAAYEVLAENRAKKGRVLSMSWSQVERLATTFPEKILCFGAFLDGTMIGAALCVIVRPDILYVYAWGERRGAEASSPVTPLAHAIHTHARATGFVLLDLGTSSINGTVNAGLAAFKRSLGAYASLKFWLRKTSLCNKQTLDTAPPPDAPVDYTAIYDPETDFDRWYSILSARRIIPFIQAGQNVLEVGSATGLLTQMLTEKQCRLVCIERSHEYADQARAKNLPNVEIHEQSVEDFTPDRMFNHILIINVLHEIPDAMAVIRTLRSCLAQDGQLHVTLPNPSSLHRLSAVGAGMIDRPDAPSERGRAYGTLRLLQPDDLVEIMSTFGLREMRREAIMVKPLPNSAMASLSDDMIEAYDMLAHDLPQNGAMTYQVFTYA